MIALADKIPEKRQEGLLLEMQTKSKPVKLSQYLPSKHTTLTMVTIGGLLAALAATLFIL